MQNFPPTPLAATLISERIRHILHSWRVHDLKHTCGRRLRAAGVSLEDRQDILAHKTGRITTHYSAPEIGNLVAAVNRIANSRGIHARTVLRLVA